MLQYYELLSTEAEVCCVVVMLQLYDQRVVLYYLATGGVLVAWQAGRVTHSACQDCQVVCPL